MADADLLVAVVRTLQAPADRGEAGLRRALAQLTREAAVARRRRLGGLAAAALALVALGVTLFRDGGPRPVRFAMAAPGAAQVALIGDFNDWDPRANPLRRQAGEWSVTLRLPPGRYRYAFVLDGRRWVADPVTPQAEDEFDIPTSAITISN
ncbi:MAG: isoamylase early set domain-containing protein [Gemmatimonadales bacterium]